MPAEVRMDEAAFVLFCAMAAANHSISCVCTFFSSSLLSPALAATSLGLLWGCNAVAGLLFASKLQKELGLKLGLYVSFAGCAPGGLPLRISC